MFEIYRKLLAGLAVFCLALLLSVNVALAATLNLNSIGGVSTGTGTLTTFTTTRTNPTFLGTAAPDATVDIKIDDLTVAVTADTAGAWSYTPTALTEGAHSVEISSNLESLSFTLTVDADGTSGTSTSSATTTKGGDSTASAQAQLPKSGAVENTMLVIAGGVALIGAGLVAHQLQPARGDE